MEPVTFVSTLVPTLVASQIAVAAAGLAGLALTALAIVRDVGHRGHTVRRSEERAARPSLARG